MTRLCNHHDLRRFAESAFLAAGLTEEDARSAADVLCYADLRGHTTHGTVAIALIHLPLLRAGRITIDAISRTIRDTGACVLVDGANRMGLLVGTGAVDLAISRARRFGTAVVGVRNSNHFGAAGFYTRRAAQAGVIGLAMTNCGGLGVAPPLDGVRRLLGTNPISAAAPTNGSAPFALDMSTTVVASGKLKAARESGHPVPHGWLLRPDGTDTTDPHEYYQGTANLAWLGGRAETGAAKGFGLGLLVELLAGALTGAAVGPTGNAADVLQGNNIGHLFLAIDPDAFVGKGQFVEVADEVLSVLGTSEPVRVGHPVRYPGMPEATTLERSLRDGVVLPDYVVRALDEVAAELRLPALATNEVTR